MKGSHFAMVMIMAIMATQSTTAVDWTRLTNAILKPENKSNSYGPFDTPASPCSPRLCRLPNCRCSGTDIPGGLAVSDTPQMVLFSFQTAVNDINFKLYKGLFQGRTNPNGCPRTGTFFVSHNYTDYWEVQSLYSDRHEIGDNTVTSLPKPKSEAMWSRQMASQMIILSRWANINTHDVQGFRAPGLGVGGDLMISAMSDVRLSYDSSFTTVKHSQAPNLLWPYTFDYATTQDCVAGPCPTQSHPGVWEIPLVTWPDKETSTQWAVPAAVPNIETEDDAFNLLRDKFVEHYHSSNHAPLPIVLDSVWLVTDYKYKGTLRFMDYLNKFEDVYAVSNMQALQWVRSPVSLKDLDHRDPFSCSGRPSSVCRIEDALTCQFGADRKLIRPGQPGTPVWKLHACIAICPPCYPGLGDPYGLFCNRSTP